METIASPLLRALFDVEISRVLLRADMPVFTIVDANAFYLKQTLTEGKEIKGKGLFQIFDPEKAGGGDVTLKNGLINAVKENRSVKLEPFKYDISSADGLEMITSWWDAEILPIRGNDGKPKYLLVTTQNVTDSILNAKLLADADKRERELNQQLAGMNEELAATNEELEASNEELLATITELSVSQGELQNINETLEVKISERIAELAKSESSLRSLVMTAHYPLMILRGRDWIIEIANQPLVNLWDRTIEEVTGRKLMDILPEIEDQPFPGFLRQVYDTGVGYGQEEQVFHYNAPTGPATKYVSFYYDPLRDENGEVAGIIVAANDITAQVHSRQQLEKSNQDQQALNEEFAAINEELAATIEELSASNEELVLAQKDIEYKNSELATSEGRFRALIRQAPVAICVIRAEDLMIQEVNDAYLELVGKERSAMEERTIWEAVPEAAGSYAPVMEEVIRTGITFSGREHELILIKNGIPENVFIDFIYEPVKENSGSVTAIMVLGIDVSDKVKARRSIEDVEERIRLAVDAAGIGTFDLNVPENTLVTSDRFNELYGFDSTQPRDEYLKIFHPDDLHLSKSAH
ncbi:MAG: PAS domain S-box protein, partial [Pedobacter sp.]